MARVRQEREVPLPVDGALALWTDPRRWATFVEGFKHVETVDEGWPAQGSKVVWDSVPGGRGRVTERVVENRSGSGAPARFATQLFETALIGTQTATFTRGSDAGRTWVALELEYELAGEGITRRGPLARVADVLFIRRALSDALARTLRRFATEAADESAL